MRCSSEKKKYLSCCLVNIASGLYKSQTDRVTKFTNSGADLARRCRRRRRESSKEIVKCYTKSRHVLTVMIYNVLLFLRDHNARAFHASHVIMRGISFIDPFRAPFLFLGFVSNRDAFFFRFRFSFETSEKEVEELSC